MSAPNEKPAGRGGFLRVSNCRTCANDRIVALPKQHFITCAGCGGLFALHSSWHRLCSDCFYWDRALTGIIAVRRAFRRVRNGR